MKFNVYDFIILFLFIVYGFELAAIAKLNFHDVGYWAMLLTTMAIRFFSQFGMREDMK